MSRVYSREQVRPSSSVSRAGTHVAALACRVHYKSLLRAGIFAFMDNSKKIYLAAATLIAIIVGVFFALNGRATQATSPVATTTSSTQAEAAIAEIVSNKIAASQPSAPQLSTTIPTGTAASAPQTLPAPNVTFSVAGSSYTAFATAGSTVIDAMRVLSSTTDFAFSGRDYPSLGFFVESINGQMAENGHNWILYVNGKLSGTGASQTTLKAGDAIEWRYEKNY